MTTLPTTSADQAARAGDGNLPPDRIALVERIKALAGEYADRNHGTIFGKLDSITWCQFTEALDQLAAAPAVSAPAEETAGDWAMGDWQQYAKEGETAQACIERHRREHESLLRLLAQARGEQERAYRCIQGMHNAMNKGTPFDEGYHSLTLGAAKRFVFEGALDGSDYFVGKKVEVLHAALALPALVQAPATAPAQGGANG